MGNEPAWRKEEEEKISGIENFVTGAGKLEREIR